MTATVDRLRAVLRRSGALRAIHVPRRLPNAQRTTRRVSQADGGRIVSAEHCRGQCFIAVQRHSRSLTATREYRLARTLVTFRVRRSRVEMCTGHGRLRLCVGLSVSRLIPTLLHGLELEGIVGGAL